MRPCRLSNRVDAHGRYCWRGRRNARGPLDARGRQVLPFQKSTAFVTSLRLLLEYPAPRRGPIVIMTAPSSSNCAVRSSMLLLEVPVSTSCLRFVQRTPPRPFEVGGRVSRCARLLWRGRRQWLRAPRPRRRGAPVIHRRPSLSSSGGGPSPPEGPIPC